MDAGQQKKTNPPQIQTHQSTEAQEHPQTQPQPHNNYHPNTTLSDPHGQSQVKPVRPKPQNSNLNNSNRRYPNQQGQNQGQGQGQGQGQYYNDGQRKGANPRRGKKMNPNQTQQRPRPNDNVLKEAVKPVEENKIVQAVEIVSTGQSWSSVVSSTGAGSSHIRTQPQPPQPSQQPHPPTQTHAPHPPAAAQHPQKNRNRGHVNGQKKEYQQKNPREEPVVEHAPQHPKEDYNADAKIEAIHNAVVQQLTEMQTKADRLKSLQEEIRKIKEEKDVEIEELLNRKAALSAKLKQLEDDLKSTKNEIGQIDTNIEHLKQEKIQKIHVLDEQSRALLSN